MSLRAAHIGLYVDAVGRVIRRGEFDLICKCAKARGRILCTVHLCANGRGQTVRSGDGDAAMREQRAMTIRHDKQTGSGGGGR